MPRPRQTKLGGRWAATESTYRPSGARQASPRVSVSPLVERRGAKSFANDLVEDRGVVIVRAVLRCDSLRVSLWSTICPCGLTAAKGLERRLPRGRCCSKTSNLKFRLWKKNTSFFFSKIFFPYSIFCFERPLPKGKWSLFFFAKSFSWKWNVQKNTNFNYL